MGYLIQSDTAIKLSKDFASSQKKLVFTHGAFDLFHAGHSLFLNKSKREGDILIVGLEPDTNIGKYKGVLRPIIKQRDRAEILTNHISVDFVFFIDEVDEVRNEYYFNLYKSLKPKTITVGKKFSDPTRKNYKLDDSSVKEIDAEVSSTTKIISAILKTHVS